VNQGDARRLAGLAASYAYGTVFPDKGLRQLVIFTPGRTGSELLVTLLDGHPQIRCEAEILRQPRRQPLRYVNGRARRALTSARKSGKRAEIYGWKVITSQLHWYPERYADPTGFLAACTAESGLLVVLRRRNLLNQALSLIHGERSGFHFGTSDGFTPMAVEPERLLAQLYWYDEADKWLVETTDSLPHLPLFYEDDLTTSDKHRATVALICRRLGVPFVPTKASLSAVAPTDPLARVSNREEVVAALAGTRYAALVDVVGDRAR
jgi:hypothetical protein